MAHVKNAMARDNPNAIHVRAEDRFNVIYVLGAECANVCNVTDVGKFKMDHKPKPVLPATGDERYYVINAMGIK